MPRLVRLGRAANDNQRRHGMLTRLVVFALAAALFGLVLLGTRLI